MNIVKSLFVAIVAFTSALAAEYIYTLTGPSGVVGHPLRVVDAAAAAELATWALMMIGFGLVGGAIRSRGRRTSVCCA